jgi:5-methylcytosine-specific restriction enzyme subunit McrC
LVNQIILKGLSILSTLTYNSQLKDKIARLKVNFPEIKEIPIQKHHFDKVKENRKTVAYSRALQIAKMIILNYSPDIRSGQENMLTLLFDMNKLWEEYIYRMLLRTKDDNLTVSFQNKQVFWEGRTIRPDLVLIKNKGEKNAETFIIDTKWKILDAANPSPSDNDLKQMYAYNLYWEAKRSMLLYPNSKAINEDFGNYWKGTDNPEHNQCKVGFINVMDENNFLNLDIGVEIIKKLNYKANSTIDLL